MVVEYSLLEIPLLAKQLLSEFSEYRIFCLEGDLGAGKTTLVEALCRDLGTNDLISSPTFSIINEYSLNNDSIYHMDWYRLNSLEEAQRIGIEDYLFSGQYCFIEWYEKAALLIPNPFVKLSILSLSSDRRSLTAELIK